MQFAQLLSIKTGGCPEDCGYCAQSAHFETGVKATKLMANEEIVAEARRAKESGATRFCMGAAWRSPKDRDVDHLCSTIEAVKGLGMETCMTLGMLTAEQARKLKDAGLDYYNHNLDTSPEHYGNIITTRTYADRLETLAHVREAGMAVCCGGILGIGETERDRASMLRELANLPEHPESVPINMLMQVEGTPLAQAKRVDALELVRTIAVARITMPASVVRLSAGREHMTRRGPGAVLHGRRQLDLRRRQAAHHRQPRAQQRREPAHPARHEKRDARRALSHTWPLSARSTRLDPSGGIGDRPWQPRPQDPIVIVGMARTAIGGFQGAFAPLTAPQLGSAAIKAAVERAGTKLEDVSEVLMGCVLPAGQGQAPARQAALGAGLPNSVPCTTVNKMCGSGMKTVMMAYEALHARPTDIMVAGGMESMTNAPYLLPKMRAGARLGHAEVKDHMFLDGLEDAYDKGRLMGTFAEECAQSYQFTREAQDAFAIESLKRSKVANEDGSFATEIVPVAVKTAYRFRRGHAGRAAVLGRPGENPQAQTGLPRRWHGHCRQFQLHLGWGGGARADARE